MSKKIIVYAFLLLGLIILAGFLILKAQNVRLPSRGEQNYNIGEEQQPSLSIEYMRKQIYPGSEITIEEMLPPGSNYSAYIASYRSEGLKIYALLTIPGGPKPEGGWPVIIFNHGYIPPKEYQTTERYIAYTDAFSRNGYIVFKPDYRGHGLSEGSTQGAYYSPSYTIDVLNAVSSIKKYEGANQDKIAMWGHSMGGNIALRALVISKEIKAVVIWAGVVGTYDELITKWRRTVPFVPPPGQASSLRVSLQKKYGLPAQNPAFWNSIDPRFHIKDITAPLQIHHGTADGTVPWEFSESLKIDLEKENKSFEYYIYNGADHNISSPNFETAMQRSVNFFNKYLKNNN